MSEMLCDCCHCWLRGRTLLQIHEPYSTQAVLGVRRSFLRDLMWMMLSCVAWWANSLRLSTRTETTHQYNLASLCFFTNSNSFGVFSHSRGFGAELLSDSLWFSGADPSLAAKRFRGRFHQGSSKGAPRFHQGYTKFRGVSGLLGQIQLGLPKGSVLKGSVEGSPRFHQGFTKVAQVS